jgi:hypothetical protein
VVVLCARMVRGKDMGRTLDVRVRKGCEQINELSCASQIKISEGRTCIGTSAGSRIDTSAGFVCNRVVSCKGVQADRRSVKTRGGAAHVVASGKEMQAARVPMPSIEG